MDELENVDFDAVELRLAEKGAKQDEESAIEDEADCEGCKI